MSAGPEKFSVRWRKSSDAGVSGYELQYQTTPASGGPWPSSWTSVGETIAAEASVTIYQYEHEGLNSDLRYRYQVRAVNAAGAGPWSAPFGGGGRRPRLPPARSRRYGGAGEVVLAWTPVGSSVRNWTYLKREQGVGWSRLWASIPGSDATTTSPTVSGLTEGHWYTFKVRAMNASGGSPPSNGATVTVLPVTFRYNQLDTTGEAAAGSYAFLSDAGGSSRAVTSANVITTYEGLRDGSATMLRINLTDADGTSRAPSTTASRWAISSSGTRPTTASCATR